MNTETGPRFLTAAERSAKDEARRARNARLNEAAELAGERIGGRVGEELRLLLHTFYDTGSAQYVDQLAKAIIAEHGHR